MKYLLIYLLCCILSSAQAQIHQPHQRFIEAGGGFLFGTQVRQLVKTSYWIKASLGKYGKKEGVYQIGIMAQLKYYQPVEEFIAVNQYFVEGIIAPKVFRTVNRLVYINPLIGLLIGYEGIHSNRTLLIDSVAVNINRALVGFTGGLNCELNIVNQIALIIFAKTNFLPSSAIDQTHFHYGLGIRFNYFK